MAERLSKQPFLVTRLDLQEINDVFIRLQNELDRLAGLRGTIQIFDSEHYVDPTGEILHSWGSKP